MTVPTGRALLRNRYLNKGTAFTTAERDVYHLHGLLPPVVETLETQLDRTRAEYDTKDTPLSRHIFLRLLQERNSVLFYSFIQRHLAEMLPVIYTPTVGEACEAWSRIYRQEHGLYISWPDRHRAAELLHNAIGDDPIDVIVATDGERILGLGDLGAGGMGIPIGKLALYTAVGGLRPDRSLPVVLDVGTENETLLADPLYLGWRHRRVRGPEYDELVDAFVDAVHDRLPGTLVQWEDFAQQNARRVLELHRDRVCSFNDDIQGTAAVAAAAVASGMRMAGIGMSELRVTILGAGSAGTGIADELVRAMTAAGLTESQARQRCWLVDRNGLLTTGMTDLADFQQPYARDDVPDDTSLLGVIEHARPHALIGVSGQPGLFHEAAIRAMAAGVQRPIVLPLSNPTPRVEATPADVISWTEGRAIVGTGSPFDAVVHDGVSHDIAQVNNVYIFPGVGLGARSVAARRVTDTMISVAAGAIAMQAPTGDLPGAPLLPPIEQSRECAQVVAAAVARAAIDDGVADPAYSGASAIELADLVARTAWEAAYRLLPLESD